MQDEATMAGYLAKIHDITSKADELIQKYNDMLDLEDTPVSKETRDLVYETVMSLSDLRFALVEVVEHTAKTDEIVDKILEVLS